MSIFSNNLRFLREKKGLKLDDFLEIGIKRGTMSNYELGNTEPKLDIIRAFSKFFGISIDDLLNIDLTCNVSNSATLDKSLQSTQPSLVIPCNLEDKGVVIPVYNAEASAGGGALRLDQEYIIGHIMVPFAKKGDIALMTVGNSMEPEISAGDILIVRQRLDWRDCIERGKVYIVVTTEEIFVKVIHSVVQDGLVLHSFNPRYEDFPIPFKIIHSIFKLIGIISQKSY